MKIGAIVVGVLGLCVLLSVAFLLAASPHESDAGRPQSGGGLRASGKASRALARSQDELRVYVVEEHHEALPYWVDHKAGGLLVHIDAHPDLALPTRFSSIGRMGPDRPGSSALEASRPKANVWMQANDEFITSSVIMGAHSVLVWVWPAWDAEGPRHLHRNHTGTLPLLRRDHLGVAEPDRSCSCVTGTLEWDPLDGPPPELEELGPMRCQDAEDADIPQETCVFKASALTLTIGEETLLSWDPKRLSFWRMWLEGFKHATLDMDEDYFSKADFANRLDAALGSKSLGRLNALLADFCPDADVGEAAAAAELVGAARGCREAGAGAACAALLGSAGTRLRDLACGGLEAFYAELARLNEDQLLVLEEAGFSLSTSFASTGEKVGMQVLAEGKAQRGWTDTVDTRATNALAGSPVEMRRRLARFPATLERLGRRFDVATLCRSVRDHYTPLALAPGIERSMLRDVARMAAESGQRAVSYFDAGLLAGPAGHAAAFGYDALADVAPRAAPRP